MKSKKNIILECIHQLFSTFLHPIFSHLTVYVRCSGVVAHNIGGPVANVNAPVENTERERLDTLQNRVNREKNEAKIKFAP